ncbi:hypothetical protein O9X98_06625 [Agrobacterium salinitolerans]|nr:hypothetical protein [Agrobacterium salinitolerans]
MATVIPPKELAQVLGHHLRIPDAVVHIAITEDGKHVISGVFNAIAPIKAYLSHHMRPGRLFAVEVFKINEPGFLMPESQKVH